MSETAPSEAQREACTSQQEGVSLLTGFMTAAAHKAIQENIYVILGHGALQRRVLFTGMLSVVVLLLHALADQLVAREFRHWCAPPSELQDLPTDAWKNAAIPLGPDGEPSQCDVYDPPLSKGADQRRHVAHCKKWAYDTSDSDDSIVSRWDLVCDRDWLLKLSKTVYVMGAVLFVPAAGLLADRFGRRPAIVGNAVGALLFSVGAFISERFTMFVVSRFFVSACSCSAQVLVFILLYEVTGNERRALYGLLDTAVGTTLLELSVHLLSALEPQWYQAHSILILPTAMLVFWCYLIEESPSWLLVAWNARHADEIILLSAALNGVDINKAHASLKALRKQISKNERMAATTVTTMAEGYIQSVLFRRRMAAVLLSWFSVNFTYYGHVLRAVSSNHLWHVAQAVTQAGLYYVVWRILHRHGQRETLSVLLAVLCLLTALKGSVLLLDAHSLGTLMEALVESVSSTALSLNYGYTADVFPTISRSLGLCIAYAFGRLGVLAVITLSQVAGSEGDAAISLIMMIFVLLSVMAIQSLPEAFVEKGKEQQPRSSMSETERKAVIQASLSPMTPPTPPRHDRRSRRKSRTSARPSMSSVSPRDKRKTSGRSEGVEEP
ncbi:solute carrier family 22 member 7-like [Dermacentor andersoni]|uniref:solute carrier family 22 member 7-like n=1 Tax=Dermacentor andersoni TaxID=34620 RepID=UPI002155B6EC